jgi:hypothetical protein
MVTALTTCFGEGNHAAKDLQNPNQPTQDNFAGFHHPPSLVVTVPIESLPGMLSQARPVHASDHHQQLLKQPSLGATVMESSEASVSTQDQLATAVLQTAMKQHLEQYRQQILAEVSDQMRVVDSRIGAVDSRISAVDSRISSVEEVTSHTQREVSLLQSQSREMFQELKEQSVSMQTQTQTAHLQTDAKLDAFKEEARLQREQSQSQFQAMMTAMAELTHSKRKDT